MMLRLLLVCCVVRWAAADDTLFFVPHDNLSKNFSCPDNTQCPVGNTCCPAGNGKDYGCCPYGHAVCCSDGIHCCQRGTECRPDGGGCVHPNSVTNQRPQVVKTLTKSTICPDGQGMCPSGQTCCEGKNGVFACCPYEGAVCCKDRIHCCQNGLYCDLQAGGCIKKGIGYMLTTLFNRPLTRTKPASSQVSTPALTIKCDDGSECPDGNTCCKMTTGAFGCCPLPQESYLPWVEKMPASRGKSKDAKIEHFVIDTAVKNITKGKSSDVSLGQGLLGDRLLGDVQCSTEKSCPNGYTCCQMPGGQWWCCSYPDAFCCKDGLHCCPQGTVQCDIAEGKCNKQDGSSVPWAEKTPAIVKNPTSVECDETHECPDGNTCCKLSSGQWGCCPMPKAVCCSDGAHCCPSGTTCDLTTGACDRGDGTSVSWFEKTPAVSKKVESVVCPGGAGECPDGNTCCKLSSGEWGCCPLPEAVCCSDGTHCCPSGSTCDVSQGTCTKQDGSVVTWLKKTLAISKKLEDVVCPDGSSECPDGNTCCKLSSGQWGCCPLPQV